METNNKKEKKAVDIKKRVNTIGKVGRVISIIMIVCMALGCLGLMVAGIVVAAVPKDSIRFDVKAEAELTVTENLLGSHTEKITDKVIDEINDNISSSHGEPVDVTARKTDDGLVFDINTGRYSFALSNLLPLIIAGFLCCGLILTVFIFLLRLSDAFAHCDSPFDDLVIKRMTVFAWVLLGASLLASFIGSVGSSLSLDIPFLQKGLKLGNFSVSPILVSLIVLFLTSIFRYGAKLQKQADETL